MFADVEIAPGAVGTSGWELQAMDGQVSGPWPGDFSGRGFSGNFVLPSGSGSATMKPMSYAHKTRTDRTELYGPYCPAIPFRACRLKRR